MRIYRARGGPLVLSAWANDARPCPPKVAFDGN